MTTRIRWKETYIQWGFSQFFPAKAMCAHVTSWNKNTSIKFRTDMASMCKLGFDIGLKEMAAEELGILPACGSQLETFAAGDSGWGTVPSGISV